MDPIIMKFRDKFIDEANNLLDNLEVTLLGLERTPDNKELIDSAFRAMHTLKGISGMYSFMHIYNFTHHFESIYQTIRDGQLEFNKSIFDLTFKSVDHIRSLLADENLDNPENRTEHEKLMALLDSRNPGEGNIVNKETASIQKEKKDATWHILMHTNEQQFYRGINFTAIFTELAGLGEYTIFKLENRENKAFDTWSIYLVSDASETEIMEVIMFIEDDCIINRIHNGNILSHDQNVNPLYSLQSASLDNTDEDFTLSQLADNDFKSVTGSANTEKPTDEESRRKTGESNVKKVNKRLSVDSQKLDNLMFLVSELITINSQLLVSSRNPKYFELRPLIEKVDDLSNRFRNNALEIRLVPISESVVRFQRLIRDLSKQLNKKVEFIMQGDDTELDKNIIDQLADPLMHLVRNCIDHGIELAEERLANGKPETGIIKLTAVNTGSFIYLTIADDGAGLDTFKIRRKAIEKGIIKDSDQLSNKEIYDLIFQPGFSTAQNVTELSGRGVGMDVVKKRIAELRGEVFIESEKGKGTNFILKLQQSLSIIDTLLFRVETTYFIIPLSNIEVCDEITDAEIDANRHTSTIPYNNELVYFVDLRQLFNLPEKYTVKTKMIIVNNGFSRVALLVDKIVGEHQAVTKPLGEVFKNHKYITSVSQMGDGNNAFMIDTGEIIRDSQLNTVA